MLIKALKILVAFILLSAFFVGVFGATMEVFAICGIFVIMFIFMIYLIKKCLRGIKYIYEILHKIFNRHRQLCKWIIFATYTILLLFPFIKEIIKMISLNTLYQHIYFAILCIILLGYIIRYWGKRIKYHYEAYKQTYNDKKNFNIWGINNISITFIDYLWNNYYDINKKSFYWMRKFLTLYCYPLFLLSYVICLTNNRDILSTTITIGSIFIAGFSLWYSVNNKMGKSNNENPQAIENLKPTKSEASNRYNQTWEE